MELSDELESLVAIFGDEVSHSIDRDGKALVNVFKGKKLVITLKLRDDYPNSQPDMELSLQYSIPELGKCLTDLATDSLGDPMLFQLIEAARDWVQKHPNEDGCSSRDVSPVCGADASVCKFFKQGKCKFGDKCKFLHPQKGISPAMSGPNPDAAEKPAPPKHEAKNGSQPQEKEARHSGIQEANGTEKKSSMRQATDVISRILWDGDLPTEQFSIGYLDRFVGIIEKPFSAFSWEDIASVGPSVLSVPKHRIQYFKFRDQIVWDKRSQEDNFFGSRGGTTIDEIVKNSATANQVLQVEDPLELSPQKASPQKYSDKDRLTHFLCIHVSDSETVANITKVQDHVINISPQLKEGLVSPTAFHVTLCMLRLENEQHVAKAAEALEKLKPHFLHLLPRCINLKLDGVDNFKDRLIYVKVAPNTALTKLVSLLLERLQAAGVQTPGNHSEYTPHVTIVKMSRPMQRELNARIAGQAAYSKFQDEFLGQQQMQSIHLCSMHGPKQEDGFFLRHHAVSNSLIHLLPEMSRPLQQTIELLSKHGRISDQEKATLLTAVTITGSPDESKFEETLKTIATSNLPTTQNEQATVIILRGVPGSGKSFLATSSSEFQSNPSRFTICSADEFFIKDGTYKFVPELIPEAHLYCLQQFLKAITESEIVIVDNTNSQLWEYQIYCYLSELLHLEVHIVEVPCPTDAIAEKFRSRNQHSIDSTALSNTRQRWQKDDKACLVPPKVAYPTSSANKPAFSLESLIQPDRAQIQLLNSLSSLFAVYTGIFLTPESQWQLVSSFPPSFPNVHADHVTLCFKPTPEALAATKIGQKVKVCVTSEETNGDIQAVRVQAPSDVYCEAENPHITISTDSGVSPKTSATVLGKSHASAKSAKSLVLEGTVGIVVRQLLETDKTESESTDEASARIESGKMPICTITSVPTFRQNVVRKLYPKQEFMEEQVSIHTGTDDKITEIYLFDFDGTLFHSPYPEEGKAMYKERTGQKWPHQGWWSCPESLSPPLDVHPGPAIPDFRSHIGRSGSVTFILTSRITRTKGSLADLLKQASLFPDRILTKPDDSKQMPSHVFKGIAVRDLLSEFPSVNRIKFWDDKQDNLTEVERVAKLTKPDVQVDLVYMKPPASLDFDLSTEALVKSKNSSINSFLEADLSFYCYMPSRTYSQAATVGVQFLAQQFAQVINYEDDPNLLAHSFGSFPLGRSSDVDLCLLAPPTNSPIEFAERLASQLELCGLKFVHIGRSSRCPRLKVSIQFIETGAIDYDIVFAVLSDSSTLGKLDSLTVPDIQTKLKSGDSASKAAFTGPVFLHHVREAIQGNVSANTFAAVVEMTVQILRANHLKGNAFHCVRTFHIIQLLADFIMSRSKTTATAEWDADLLFKEFSITCSQLAVPKWKKLFGVFVPQQYIERIIRVFNAVRSQVEASRFPSPACYHALQSPTPLSAHSNVMVSICTENRVVLWKAASLIEAKLPAYIRKLLDSGVDLVPMLFTINEKSCSFHFAVPESTTKEAIQQAFRPFWSEVSEYRQLENTTIELAFQKLKDEPTTSSLDSITQRYADLVATFCSGSESELHLPLGLSAYERRLVHEAAERMGVEHKTVDKDSTPHIVLRKTV